MRLSYRVDIADWLLYLRRMARKLRVQYSGAIYHVMNRGDRREPIFTDEACRFACRFSRCQSLRGRERRDVRPANHSSHSRGGNRSGAGSREPRPTGRRGSGNRLGAARSGGARSGRCHPRSVKYMRARKKQSRISMRKTASLTFPPRSATIAACLVRPKTNSPSPAAPSTCGREKSNFLPVIQRQRWLPLSSSWHR